MGKQLIPPDPSDIQDVALREALEELEEFPNGDHDDIVDTLSQAANISVPAEKPKAEPMRAPSAMAV